MKKIIILGALGVGKKALVEAMQKLQNQNFTVAEIVELKEQISKQNNDFEQLIKNILKDAEKIRLKESRYHRPYVPGRNPKGGKGQRARNRTAFKCKFNNNQKRK